MSQTSASNNDTALHLAPISTCVLPPSVRAFPTHVIEAQNHLHSLRAGLRQNPMDVFVKDFLSTQLSQCICSKYITANPYSLLERKRDNKPTEWRSHIQYLSRTMGWGEKGLTSECQDISFYSEKYGGLCIKHVVREVFEQNDMIWFMGFVLFFKF